MASSAAPHGPAPLVSPQDLKAETIARSPLKRGVTLDEVGAAAVYLASDGAAGVTGQTLYVDAGFSAVV